MLAIGVILPYLEDRAISKAGIELLGTMIGFADFQLGAGCALQCELLLNAPHERRPDPPVLVVRAHGKVAEVPVDVLASIFESTDSKT